MSLAFEAGRDAFFPVSLYRNRFVVRCLRGSCRLKLFPSSADRELGSEVIWTLDIFKGKNFSQCDRERKTGRKDDFITLLYTYQAKLRDTRRTEKWRFQHGACSA